MSSVMEAKELERLHRSAAAARHEAEAAFERARAMREQDAAIRARLQALARKRAEFLLKRAGVH
jgi:hypothetical protein